jgi:hypothetical protein
MPKKSSASNVEAIERRKHWRDRRVDGDRRNPARMRLVTYDCRSGSPRRESDVAGELADGDIWWDKKATQYE